jgi:hypothetical protein
MSRHEKQRHGSIQNEVIHNNNNNGLAELMIDNIESYGEIIPNQNDDMIIIEEDLDDDEDEAYETFLLIF